MMRSMRAIVKPVFYVLAISFIAWLALGQVTDILGGGKDVVLKVEGEVEGPPPATPAAGAAGGHLSNQRPVRHHEVAALSVECGTRVYQPDRAAVPRVPPAAQAAGVPHRGCVRLRRQALAHLARSAR